MKEASAEFVVVSVFFIPRIWSDGGEAAPAAGRFEALALLGHLSVRRVCDDFRQAGGPPGANAWRVSFPLRDFGRRAKRNINHVDSKGVLST